MSPIMMSLTVLCVVAFASTRLAAAGSLEAVHEQKRQQQPTNNSETEPLPTNFDVAPFPIGVECPQGEKHAPGSLPTCEPTCSNPKPTCMKMYYVDMDYVPCFCEGGRVRDEKTKQCVDPEDCPKAS